MYQVGAAEEDESDEVGDTLRHGYHPPQSGGCSGKPSTLSPTDGAEPGHTQPMFKGAASAGSRRERSQEPARRSKSPKQFENQSPQSADRAGPVSCPTPRADEEASGSGALTDAGTGELGAAVAEPKDRAAEEESGTSDIRDSLSGFASSTEGLSLIHI